MFKHFVTQFLGIKEEYLEGDHVEGTEQGLLIELSTRARRLTCPGCKAKTKKIRNYRVQRIKGRFIEEKPVLLSLRKRRYKCTHCGKTFYDTFSVCVTLSTAEPFL